MNVVPSFAANIANFLLAWVTPWRPAFLAIAPRSGLRFHVHHRDVVGRHIAKYGAHEPELTAWIDRFLRDAPRGVVLDIGANVGWHALHAARHNNVELVVAFEPDAFNAWLLDRNVGTNNIEKVVTIGSAVGMAGGMAWLSRYKASNNGRHSLAVDHGLSSRLVPVTTLDDAVSGLGLTDRPVLLVKIDVEGYEPAVISGGVETRRRASAIVTEFSPALSASGGLSLPAMIDQLDGLGFRPHRLGRDAALEAVSLGDLRALKDQIDVIWLRAMAG